MKTLPGKTRAVFLTLLFTFVTLSLLAHDPQSDDIRRTSLKGDVKSVKETSYKTMQRSGEIKKGKRKREYRWQKDFAITYNDRGLKTEKTLWYSNGKIYRKLSYTYDIQGNLVEEKSFGANGSVSEIAKTVNTYDHNGKLLERKTYRDNGMLNARFMYEHDSLGNYYENLVLDSSGMKSRLTRKFDSRWNVTEWYFYNSDQSIELKYLYTYDANGNLLEAPWYESGTKLVLTYKYKYDANGNRIQRDVCGPSEQNCEGWTYKYEYDAVGNWIKVTEYRNGKPVFIKEREIAYF